MRFTLSKIKGSLNSLVLSTFSCLPPGMTDAPAPKLLPTTAAELEQGLAYALRHDGKKQFKHSGEMLAQITASHLVRWLAQSGFVVMRQPPAEVTGDCPYATSARRAMEES